MDKENENIQVEMMLRNKNEFKLIDEITITLKKLLVEGNISDFTINTYFNQKFNMYVQSNYKIESILNSKRDELIISIYKKFKDNKLGTSSFSLNLLDDYNEFDSKLNDAIFICSQAKSKYYKLPLNTDENVSDKNIDYEQFYSKKFEKDFNSINLNLFYEDKLNIFRKLIDDENNLNLKSKADKENKVTFKLNYIEFLNSLSKKSINTSTNISKSYKKNSSYMEFVLSAKINNSISSKENEYIIYQDINDIYSFNFENFFIKSIENAKMSLFAKTISSFKGNIILSNKTINDFFNPDLSQNSIIGHCSGKLKYMKISKFELGQEILNFKEDKLSIYSNPLLKNNILSTPYDSFGISAKKICLIEKGIFKNYFLNKQYADYLDLKTTGPFGVIEIDSGKEEFGDLINLKEKKIIYSNINSNKYIEIISFSSFVPDMISGDFSAEIRLGFIYENNKKIPFKGGLFTGNIFKILENIKISKERVNFKGYNGPKHILFRNGEIIGV